MWARALVLTAFCLTPPVAASAGTQGADPVAATPVAEPALPSGVERGASVEGITEYRFENGLRVLLFPDAGTPTTLVNVTYSVGAASEGQGESGMAHLLEHLLFKGTPTTPSITAEFRRRGITANGTTAQDRTNYYGWFSPDDETLEWLLGLEADRMVNADVAQSDLDSEMTVVRNEMEISENQPPSMVRNALTAQAYRWHPYGRSVLGNRSEVENVPIDRLRAFYTKWYQPDNATVIIAGSFDPTATLELVDRTLGKIPRPERTLPVSYVREPAQDGEREITIRRVGEAPLIGIGYHTPAVTHPDTPALQVLDSVMGSNPSGRLYQALVEPRLATISQTGVDTAISPGMMSFFAAGSRETDIAQLEAAMLAEIETLASRPITEAEVAAAKRRIANANDRANQANVIGVANGLSEWIAAGDWRLWFLNRDAVEAVTTADVNRVAQTYLVRANRTVARFIPTDDPERVVIAQAPPAAELLEGYEGRGAVPPGEVFDTSFANIAARTETFTLDDTLKVALLPKQSRGDQVTALMMFRFGDEASIAPYRDAASIAGSLLMRGTEELDARQLDARMDELNARISVNGASQVVIASITTAGDQLIPSLRLVNDILREPRFDAGEFERLRGQGLEALDARRREPGQLVDYAMRRHFDGRPQGHLQSERSIDEEIAGLRSLTLEEVRRFHREFYGTARGEIAVVGSFDPARVKAELAALFPQWHSEHPFEKIETPYFEPAQSVRRSFETPDKANAVIVARSAFRIDAEDIDHPALLVASRVFGGDSTVSRLGARIRGTDGLSYYVGSGVIVDPDSPIGTFYMQATSAPENMPQVEAAMREELARYVRDGITQAELDDARNLLLDTYLDGRSSDRSLAATLRANLFFDRTPQWDAQFEERIRGLTLDEVNAAIRRNIRPEAISTFVAGDFESIAPTR